jgi:hypothetical protein
MPELAAQLLPRGLELATHPPHATRPGVTSKGVDDRAPDASLRKGLELDASTFVESMRCVDQPDHPALDQVSEVDRVGHRGGHAARERLDEGEAVFDSLALGVAYRGSLHRGLRRRSKLRLPRAQWL